MNLKTTNATRVFVIDAKKDSDKITLKDPSPQMEPADVQRFYSAQHPILTNSTIEGPIMRDDTIVYTFKTIIGEKG